MIRIQPYRRLVFAVYLAGLLIVTLAPLPGEAYELAAGSDKVVHFGLFAGFSVLLYWNLLSSVPPGMIVVVGGAALAAGLIELMQTALPFRSGDVWDFVWGALGALLAYGVVHAIVVRTR